MSSNRGWIQRTLAHQAAGNVPFNFMFSPPAADLVKEHYAISDIDEGLNLPIRMNGLTGKKPLYADPDIYGDTIEDDYGVIWSTSKIDRGAPIRPCLTEPNLSHYQFPDFTETWRLEHLTEWCDVNRENFTVLWVGDLWERATFMRGMEDLLLDLAVNPSFVEALLHGLKERLVNTIRTLCERFTFDAIALSDDYGTQRAMLMSPQDWRTFIRPHIEEIFALVKQYDRICFLHSCGNIYPIIPDLIDVGLDILHPIQPETMDIIQLKREFGHHLTFCGGIRTQDLLPRGSVHEIRDEVRRLKERMGRDGGYILEPGITIQADVPIENIAAMIDEARANYYPEQ
ncbi:MAG: uroporphyrinogen decarboxylase family protein [Planctomycetota bacterium]|jgi:uroporphyrinogen decarboxylase